MTAKHTRSRLYGSARHDVQANSREIVSLPGMVRYSRFVHLLPDRLLCCGGEGSQYGCSGRRRLGEVAPVCLLVGEGPAEGNLLDLGLGETGPHDELPGTPRIGHNEGARCLRVGRSDMSLRLNHPAHERECRVALTGGPDGEGLSLRACLVRFKLLSKPPRQQPERLKDRWCTSLSGTRA
jgi:hypothetical protein